MKRKYMLKKIISLIFALTLIAMLATTAVAMETRASKLIISILALQAQMPTERSMSLSLLQGKG